MASQEHLQQLTNDDDESSSSSTSISTDDEDDDDVGKVTATTALPNSSSATYIAQKTTHRLPIKALPKTHVPPRDALPTPKQQQQKAPQPKMRIKLSMRRLPTKALAAENATRVSSSSDKKKVTPSKTVSSGGRLDDEDEVKAMIVDDSDEAGDVDAVAAVVETPPSPKGSTGKGTAVSVASNSKATASGAGSTNKRQRGSNPIQRSIRLPPLSSPGLLLPPTSGVFRGAADSKGFATPSSVFDHAMSLAGYSTESRTTLPHRGSSVKRCVGDMFDSNVKLSLHFPDLVPQELITVVDPPDGGSNENGQKRETPAQILLRKLSSSCPSNGVKTHTESPKDKTSRKRRRPLQFDDMIPVSLTLPFPESYIQKRLEYVKAVQDREHAIIAFQDAEEKAEIAQERYEEVLLAHSKKGTEADAPKPPSLPDPIQIPPIPEPPTPPNLIELQGFPFETMSDDHPRYFPRDKEFLVAHLDRECFHITEGRYFGLTSSEIADPLFVGPNAPGVIGNLTASTGLATVTTGNASSMGVTSATHSPGNFASTVAAGATAAIVPTAAKSSGGLSKESSSSSSAKKQLQLIETASIADEPEATAVVTAMDDTAATATSVTTTAKVGTSKKKKKGLTPTATSSSLRKIMEDGGEQAELMRNCIIRAAVSASCAGSHGQSFVGCNGETYPDISKAFAAHAGLKPCNRCKTNKQGAYHCRLRRKHKELDYDGGNSPAVLAPLFQATAEELLWKPPG